MVRRGAIYLSFCFLFLTSCQSLYTEKDHYNDIDNALLAGNTTEAHQLLEDNKSIVYAEKDKVLYYLELGMLLHYDKKYEESNEYLTKAEYAIEELLTNSISKGILSGVLNDNALDYPGEDYEDLYINIFKALNFMHMDMYSEAMVEIRRLNNKLNYLEDKYSDSIDSFNQGEDIDVPQGDVEFFNSALARYLGVIGYRGDRLYDDSRIESEKLLSAYYEQPNLYNFDIPYIPSEINEDGIGYLNILSFTGLPPEKVPQTLRLSSGGGMFQIYADDNTSKEEDIFLGFSTVAHSATTDGINLKIQLPKLVHRPSIVSRVELYINNDYYGSMESIESLSNIARDTFKAKQPLIFGKTVIRAISKAVVAEGSQEVISNEFGAGWGLIAGLAGDIYMNVTENSDLRISRYFPGLISAREISLKPGYYDINLIYYDNFNTIVYQDNYINFKVEENGINLVESVYLR